MIQRVGADLHSAADERPRFVPRRELARRRVPDTERIRARGESALLLLWGHPKLRHQCGHRARARATSAELEVAPRSFRPPLELRVLRRLELMSELVPPRRAARFHEPRREIKRRACAVRAKQRQRELDVVRIAVVERHRDPVPRPPLREPSETVLHRDRRQPEPFEQRELGTEHGDTHPEPIERTLVVPVDPVVADDREPWARPRIAVPVRETHEPTNSPSAHGFTSRRSIRIVSTSAHRIQKLPVIRIEKKRSPNQHESTSAIVAPTSPSDSCRSNRSFASFIPFSPRRQHFQRRKQNTRSPKIPSSPSMRRYVLCALSLT